MREPRTPDHPFRGYSLVELLIVVAIIAVLAAVSLPAIMNYLRHYKIRGAAQQVAGEIQAARGQAIKKNVNLGAVFLTMSSTTYRWAVEDDQNPTDADGFRTTRVPLATLLAPPDVAVQAGPSRSLPIGIEFSTACPAEPPGPDWDQGMRFNRLGAACNPDGGNPDCPDLTAGLDFVLNTAVGDFYICLLQPDTGLSRSITVKPGGRVLVEP